MAGIVVPAGHFAVGSDLVPDYHAPGVGVGACELHDVFVRAGFVCGYFDYVAAVGVADVAGVADARAGGVGDAAEAGCVVFTVGGRAGPVGVGGGGSGC